MNKNLADTRGRFDHYQATFIGVLSLSAGIGFWDLTTRLFDIPDYILPSPGSICNRFIQLALDGVFLIHLAETLAEIAQGALIGIFVGVLLSIWLVHSPIAKRVLMPVIVVLQVTPKISIAPLIVLWLGLGIGSKIFLVALVTFYPILVNIVSKLESQPSYYRDLSSILAMSPLKRMFSMEIPFALPAFGAGVRIGMLQAVTASVIGEFIGARAGLGYLEKQAQDNDDIQLVIITILLLCLIGWLLYAGAATFEKRLSYKFGGAN